MYKIGSYKKSKNLESSFLAKSESLISQLIPRGEIPLQLLRLDFMRQKLLQLKVHQLPNQSNKLVGEDGEGEFLRLGFFGV